jgi:hypothetical protein
MQVVGVRFGGGPSQAAHDSVGHAGGMAEESGGDLAPRPRPKMAVTNASTAS